MGYVIVILAAYLMGSSSMAFYLSRLKKVDARKAGSGNLGASSVTVLMGWPAGIAVAVRDIGKGVLAVVLAVVIPLLKKCVRKRRAKKNPPAESPKKEE